MEREGEGGGCGFNVVKNVVVKQELSSIFKHICVRKDKRDIERKQGKQGRYLFPA